jgi:hypothetical protein
VVCPETGRRQGGGMKKMIEFDNIAGGQDGSDPLHLEVTRHDDGQYSLTVSRTNPDAEKQALVHFWLTHAVVQAIANLAEAP